MLSRLNSGTDFDDFYGRDRWSSRPEPREKGIPATSVRPTELKKELKRDIYHVCVVCFKWPIFRHCFKCHDHE